MSKTCYRLRDDTTGVSEVVGTILILAMTVILFASIILWVSNIPTPPASTKLDMDSAYVPIFPSGAGANITVRHKGGEHLFADDIRIYLTVERTGLPSTTILKLKGTYPSGHPLFGKPYGLVDGQDAVWHLGERWQYSNYSALATDKITATVVDIARNTVLWSARVHGAPGSHPPVFLDKWADRLPTSPTIDTPLTAESFRIFVRMSDADNDLFPAPLNNNRPVTATLTIYFGSPDPCKDPQVLYDDGTSGDLVAADGVWTLYRTCMDSPSLLWDGSIVLFNATDAQGHYTTSRMTLHVLANPSGAPGGSTPESGRPPNLRWNGHQGYNVFNGSEWFVKEFGAEETRSFRPNEQVVVVVGSLLLEDVRGQNRFLLQDPGLGANPPGPVVYGSSKTVTMTTKPSNTQAFSFYKYVNGYNVFTYKFDLNNITTVGTNFYPSPVLPPNYGFAQYPFEIALNDQSGHLMRAYDAINVTDNSGNKQPYPIITIFKDKDFTFKSNSFKSTATLYVQVSMLDTDASIVLGNVQIRDFLGGTQVLKAPLNGGRDPNPPLCKVSGACTGTSPPASNALVDVIPAPTNTYRFAVNLSRSDQDPWVEGRNSYSLSISLVKDVNEKYSILASPTLEVEAPLYKLDFVIGNNDATPPGTPDILYGSIYQNVNGVDSFRRTPLINGLNRGPAMKKVIAVKYLDFDRDGDLDIATSTDDKVVSAHRFEIDSFGNPIFTRNSFYTGSVECIDIATGDLTGDGAPEIVCGFKNGDVYYFKNDGSWTQIVVDTAVTKPVTAVDLGDFDGDSDRDIAVGRDDGTIWYYPNLDGFGQFLNSPVTDDWLAATECQGLPACPTSAGTIVSNTYLATWAQDSVREKIEEVALNETLKSGGTVNGGFDLDAASWSFVDWEPLPPPPYPTGLDGVRQTSGGNPGPYVDVQMPRVSGKDVSGFWLQNFTVSGAGPWTATINFHYKVFALGSQFNSLKFYVFLDPSAALPPSPTPSGQVWTSPTITATTPWTPVSGISAGFRITAPGVYYLKVAARTLYNSGGSGSANTIAGFDNITLAWSSTAGPVSKLNHYWLIDTLPNRPPASQNTFTLNFRGHRSATELDEKFVVSYATGGLSGPPLDSAFTDLFTVTSTSDSTTSPTLPNTLGGKNVWIRATDTNRTVGATLLDTLNVDRIYIRVVTTGGATGSPTTLPSGAVTTIDAGNQDSDAYDDVVAGTSTGNIYRLLGSSGGLVLQPGAWHTSASAPILGIKWMNATMAFAGLEIGFADNSKKAWIIRGSVAATVINTGEPGGGLAAPGGDNIAAFGAGDIDGDGDDDILFANTAGFLRHWRNLGGATAWWPYEIDNITSLVYDIDLGDMSNPPYLGR